MTPATVAERFPLRAPIVLPCAKCKEDVMNTIVVYDSQFGNTEQIAQAIAAALREFGQAQAIRIAPAFRVNLQGVDLLIVGSPTQGFRPTPAIQSYLATLTPASARGLAIACFDTRFRGRLMSHSAAPSMARQLSASGIEPFVAPESFFVTAWQKKGPLEAGEVERAGAWARRVYETYTASRSMLSAHA